MKQNHDCECHGASGDAKMQIFQCPACGSHNLLVILEIYGMREVVGVNPDDDVLFGYLDGQGLNYGTCSCSD
jgi:hypothetical protein